MHPLQGFGAQGLRRGWGLILILVRIIMTIGMITGIVFLLLLLLLLWVRACGGLGVCCGSVFGV